MVDFRKILIAYINDPLRFDDCSLSRDLPDREGMDFQASPTDLTEEDYLFIGSTVDGLNREETEALLRASAEAPRIMDDGDLREKLLAAADLLRDWEPGHA